MKNLNEEINRINRMINLMEATPANPTINVNHENIGELYKSICPPIKPTDKHIQEFINSGVAQKLIGHQKNQALRSLDTSNLINVAKPIVKARINSGAFEALGDELQKHIFAITKLVAYNSTENLDQVLGYLISKSFEHLATIGLDTIVNDMGVIAKGAARSLVKPFMPDDLSTKISNMFRHDMALGNLPMQLIWYLSDFITKLGWYWKHYASRRQSYKSYGETCNNVIVHVDFNGNPVEPYNPKIKLKNYFGASSSSPKIKEAMNKYNEKNILSLPGVKASFDLLEKNLIAKINTVFKTQYSPKLDD